MTEELTKEVIAIGEMAFDGNIIPLEWFNHIKLENGKPDTISILILSDIIYWHRPTTIRDEITGQIISYKKKFKSDLLQRSYKDFEKLFGFSEKQTRESLIRLERKNILKRILRTITAGTQKMSNVMFIQINPQTIFQITKKSDAVSLKGNSYFLKRNQVLSNMVTDSSIKGNTNTKNTTKITTNTLYNKNIREKEGEPNLKVFEEMITIWNTLIDSDEKSVTLNKDRIKKLKKVFKESFSNDFKVWEEYVKKIISSDFLMGRITDFKASFDWAIKESNIPKVLEGNYVKKNQKTKDKEYSGEEIVLQVKSYIETQENEIWKKTCKKIKERYGYEEFSSWFRDIEFISCKDGILTIQTITEFKRDWIENHHVPFINRTLGEITEGSLSSVAIKVKNINSSKQ